MLTDPLKWNAGVLGHFFCTMKAELGRGQLGLMRMKFLWNLPQSSIEPAIHFIILNNHSHFVHVIMLNDHTNLAV